MDTMRIGAHVSTSGGLDKGVERALAMGAETIQIFAAAPQSWRKTEYSAEGAKAFQKKAAEAGVRPVFIHGPYLINLATSDPIGLERSVDALTWSLDVCREIGAAGTIFHLGSHRGAGFEAVLSQIASAVHRALEGSPGDTWLILENSAGMGGSVGSRFAELGIIMGEVGSPRVKVCLDTQHAFAAGYDVANAQRLESALAEFEKQVGLANLVAVHANDSKIRLGGGVDRHENIGEGLIGREGFEVIMSHPAFRDLPFLLEVPGFEKKGPDKENVDILRQIREELGLGQ
jgi:deoxyribonuclease-4